MSTLSPTDPVTDAAVDLRIDPQVDPMVGGAGGGSCRLCGHRLSHVFVDLGMSPPCESYLPAERLESRETFYPLQVRVCDDCLLVQLPAHVPAEEIFSDYAYFSSYSDSWVRHAAAYVDRTVARLGLGPDASSSRWRATTGTSCSTSWRAGSGC